MTVSSWLGVTAFAALLSVACSDSGAGSGGKGSGGEAAGGDRSTDTGAVTGTGGETTGTGGSASTGMGGDASVGSVSNDCSEGDEVALGMEVFQEAQSESDPAVCDPQIMAAYYEDLVGVGEGFNLLLHYGWDAEAKKFESFLTVNVFGTATGEYPFSGTEEGDAQLTWVRPTGTCGAAAGSMTLSEVGEIEETLTGTLQVTEFFGEECPSSLSGSFTMTIVDSATF